MTSTAWMAGKLLRPHGRVSYRGCPSLPLLSNPRHKCCLPTLSPACSIMDGVVLNLLKAASKGDADVTPADLNKVISEVRRMADLSCQGQGDWLEARKGTQVQLAPARWQCMIGP